MIALLILLADYLVMPGEYLRDPTVAVLLMDEDIKVFYGNKSRRMRFKGLSELGQVLEESSWEAERRGPYTEQVELNISEIDSVWVYLPLHDVKDIGLLKECLIAGGSAAVGVPVGIATALGLII